MACKQANGTPLGIYWLTVLTKEVGTYPDAKKKCLPKNCMHCERAPCVRRCPTGASYRADNGVVLIDRDICIGCRACLEVCPYEVRCYVGEDPKKNPYWGIDFALTPYEEKKTVPLHDFGKMGKCTFCYERLQLGKDPICVQTCITRCRMAGDLDDPSSEISIAIEELDAKPLHEEYGTNPSVYYVGS
jgi:molybdopterin-containing oxidoreductase family iron-sulfur binding subunit